MAFIPRTESANDNYIDSQCSLSEFVKTYVNIPYQNYIFFALTAILVINPVFFDRAWKIVTAAW